MECYNDLIGIKSGCAVTESTSGLYIEDLSITCQEADDYVNADYENGEKLIDDKISFASKIIGKTIQNYFASQINTRQLIDSQMLGYSQDDLVLMNAVASNLGGISLSLLNKSSYFDVFVNEISLQVNYTGSVNVLVYNLVTGKLIDTIAIDCVAQEVSTKIVNKTYSSNRKKLDLIFVYDIDTIQSYKTLLRYDNCASCSGYVYSNSYITATPLIIDSASAKTRTNIVSQTHTYGMSINYSVQCSFENWLCNMSNMLALSILYKAGEEIMSYAILSSNRNNSNTNIDLERNIERRDAFHAAYVEQLTVVMKGMVLPKNDVCFSCKEVMRSVIILP